MRRVVTVLSVLAWLVAVGGPAEASFPGANGQIAFVSFGETPSRIGVIEPDGSGLAFLTAEDRRRDWEPAWSSDGQMIVFDTLNVNYDNPKIQTMAGDGTGRTVVYEAPPRVKDVFRPVWSPDASQIAFCAAVGRHYHLQIFTMSADGTALTNISGPDHLSDCNPDWSPDGTTIAFNAGGVWTMSPDGTGRAEITSHGRWPSWSPDGTTIAFARRSDRQTDLYLAEADGSGLTRLTDTAGRFEDTPAFSPDGTLVAFSRGANEFVFDSRDLFTVAIDDQAVTRITETRRSEYSPAWQPVGP